MVHTHGLDSDDESDEECGQGLGSIGTGVEESSEEVGFGDYEDEAKDRGATDRPHRDARDDDQVVNHEQAFGLLTPKKVNKNVQQPEHKVPKVAPKVAPSKQPVVPIEAGVEEHAPPVKVPPARVDAPAKGVPVPVDPIGTPAKVPKAIKNAPKDKVRIKNRISPAVQQQPDRKIKSPGKQRHIREPKKVKKVKKEIPGGQGDLIKEKNALDTKKKANKHR